MLECAAGIPRDTGIFRMDTMIELLSRPWPWYVAGPILGVFPALLLLVGNRMFGISSNLRHLCAAVAPRGPEFFRYNWKREGGWNLAFALGIVVGGAIGGILLASPEPIAIAEQTRADLAALGIQDFSGLVPADVFSFEALFTLRGIVLVVVGGLLVGFGTAYAGGCTSGHGLAGIGDLQLPSLVALVGFFVGGIFATFVLLPLVL